MVTGDSYSRLSSFGINWLFRLFEVFLLPSRKHLHVLPQPVLSNAAPVIESCPVHAASRWRQKFKVWTWAAWIPKGCLLLTSQQRWKLTCPHPPLLGSLHCVRVGGGNTPTDGRCCCYGLPIRSLLVSLKEQGRDASLLQTGGHLSSV